MSDEQRWSFTVQLPGEHKLSHFDADGNMQEISVDQLTKDKKASSVCAALHGIAVFQNARSRAGLSTIGGTWGTLDAIAWH